MSAFVIKIIAAVTMFIDHAGLLLFPEYKILRVIGRIAFPLYAYCIAEGFRYTKNRLHYFLRIFILGVICQTVYTVVDRELYLGILLTFSLSILVMFCTENVRQAYHGEKSALVQWLETRIGKALSPESDKMLSLVFCVCIVTLVFLLTVFVEVDYGFFGVMLPVFTNLFRERGKRFVMFAACLLALCIEMTVSLPIQYWSLLTIPLIALYNGKPGKYRFKYFFYIFYPAHMVLLYALSMFF